MSFLTDFRIRTKILCLTVPACLIGVASSAYVSFNFKAADTSYSEFITKNNVATIEMVRASAIITNLAYTTYQMLAYDPKAPEVAALQARFSENRQLLQKRFETAKQLVPESSGEIDGFSDRYREIGRVADQALALNSDGHPVEARNVLVRGDQAIVGLIKDMRSWNDTATKHILDQSAALARDTNTTILTTSVALALVFGSAVLLSLYVSSKGITGPIEKLRARMLALSKGETATPVYGVGRKDEVGDMAEAVLVFLNNALDRARLEAEAEASRNGNERERAHREAQKAKESAEIRFAVDTLGQALERLSEGDVSHRIAASFAEGLDRLRTNFNESAEKLQAALTDVGANARVIEAGAREIQAGADDLSRRTEQQAASIEETAAALEQITTAVRDSTARAEEAGNLVEGARKGAEHSGAVVREAIGAMQKIEASSGEIGNIIGVIDEIAFQTNLLALNAGVEAARAGEAGKGFAVVAQEVRELAQRSARAAKEIKVLIDASGAHVRTGVKLVGDTGTSLHAIVSEVQAINRHVTAIIQAAREQSIGLQEINIAVNSMDQGTQQNAAMVEQSTAASHTLAGEVVALNALLSQFRLGDGPAVPRDYRGEEGRPTARAPRLRLAHAFDGSATARKFDLAQDF